MTSDDAVFESFVDGFWVIDECIRHGMDVFSAVRRAQRAAIDMDDAKLALAYLRGAELRFWHAIGWMDGVDAASRRPKVPGWAARMYWAGYQIGIRDRRMNIQRMGEIGAILKPASGCRPRPILDEEPPSGSGADVQHKKGANG